MESKRRVTLRIQTLESKVTPICADDCLEGGGVLRNMRQYGSMANGNLRSVGTCVGGTYNGQSVVQLFYGQLAAVADY